MNTFALLKSPVVTEKSARLKEKYHQYVFKVVPEASKGQIKETIKKIFNVDVERVRTAHFSGKYRRLAAGRPRGKRPDWKKAIVTIKKGQEIKIEQEVEK